MDINNLQHHFNRYHEKTLYGRYIRLQDIEPLIKFSDDFCNVSVVGKSVFDRPIYSLILGRGKKRILMWSQMHGNETTTTKALFDVLNTLQTSMWKPILDACTLCIIPILNPDGAENYTRSNANLIDLNRDAQKLSQPETNALMCIFKQFKPDFCFNLHGQRTIFSAGKTQNPATISFLSPAQDANCSLTDTRKKAMEVIVEINKQLQTIIPNRVGIYDDAFNLNCVGDTFQSLNVPTILFEAGHSPHDYQREITRQYIYQSLLISIKYIGATTITGKKSTDYFNIPQNEKCFYDVILRHCNVEFKDNFPDIAIQYEEQLTNNQIVFKPRVELIAENIKQFGHREINAGKKSVLTINKTPIFEGYENDFIIINNEIISVKPE